MSERCPRLVHVYVNTLRGNESPHAIPVHCDGMYNNPRGMGETPFQPSTQTVYSFDENITSKHKIIKMMTNNKIYSKHLHLLDAGSRDYQYNPGVCGANLPMHHTIGDEFT